MLLSDWPLFISLLCHTLKIQVLWQLAVSGSCNSPCCNAEFSLIYVSPRTTMGQTLCDYHWWYEYINQRCDVAIPINNAWAPVMALFAHKIALSLSHRSP